METRIWIGVLTATTLALSDGCAQPGDYGGARNPTPAVMAPAQNVGPRDNNDVIAAFDADRSGNYAEALRLFQKIDAEPDPFPGLASVDYFTAKRMGREVIHDYLNEDRFLANRAGARERIGEYYEKGRAVPQDYHAAANWYAKAADRSSRAKIRLAFLYANGLGVSRDRVKARELLVSLGPSDKYMVVLLDHDLLPKSPEDLTRSYFQTAAAKISDAEAAVIITILAASAQNRASTPRIGPSESRGPNSIVCLPGAAIVAAAVGCPPWTW